MYLSLASSRERISKLLRIYSLLSLLLTSTTPLCWANSSPLEKDNGITSLLDKQSLGDCADIEVPQGYRFIGAEGARVMLDRMNNPVEPGLLGVLAPLDGKWLAVLEFEPIGYVKNVDEQQVDFEAILKAVENRHENNVRSQLNGAAPRIASLEWEIQPKYDTDAHSLEWAIRAGTSSGKVVNHTVALFGRRGVLEVTVVQPYQSSPFDLVPLKELVKRITFKEGQRYSDYQEGDKMASAGMQEVIVGENEPPTPDHQDAPAAASLVPSVKTWIFTAVGGCVALGVGMLAYKKLRKPKTAVAVKANGHALPGLQTNGVSNGTKNGAHKRNGTARKHRDFNYSKYYSDMVMQLSGTSYHWVAPAGENSRQRAVATPPSPQPLPAVPQVTANLNLEIIACQKNLIEEQKNLMREQTRIIEEKARLIREYSQLVERLSQDVDSQFSLKLD